VEVERGSPLGRGGGGGLAVVGSSRPSGSPLGGMANVFEPFGRLAGAAERAVFA